MGLQSFDRWARETWAHKVAVVTLCAWTAGVLAVAAWSAYRSGMEPYRWTAIGLLLIGVPLGLVALGYAMVLLGKRGRIALLALVLLACVAAGVVAGIKAHQETVRHEAWVARAAEEVARAAAEDRERAIQKAAEDRETAIHKAAIDAQHAADWKQFGQVCTNACSNIERRRGNPYADLIDADINHTQANLQTAADETLQSAPPSVAPIAKQANPYDDLVAADIASQNSTAKQQPDSVSGQPAQVATVPLPGAEYDAAWDELEKHETAQCATRCVAIRGDQQRQARQKPKNTSCAEQCTADTDSNCEVACEAVNSLR